MSEANGKRIGDLNGSWSLLLRFALATYPFVLMWSIWVTTEVFGLRAAAMVTSTHHDWSMDAFASHHERIARLEEWRALNGQPPRRE